MEILSNKDLKEFTKYTALKLVSTIGMIEILLATCEQDSNLHKSLALVHKRLVITHDDIQRLDMRLHGQL